MTDKVAYEDVVALREQFQPGEVVPSVKLYARYEALMIAAGRPVEHQTSLGHALRRADWTRKRVRKSVGSKIQETASWVIPGKPALSEGDAHVYDALDALGEGIHPNLTIFAKYQELARREGWSSTLDLNGLQRWLTRKGFVRLRDKGKACRYVAAERVAARA